MTGVVAGMTGRQVRRLLGRPLNRITEKQFLGLYSNVVRLGPRRRLGREAWMYIDVPGVGQTTFIDFERGRVKTVQVHERER